MDFMVVVIRLNDGPTLPNDILKKKTLEFEWQKFEAWLNDVNKKKHLLFSVIILCHRIVVRSLRILMDKCSDKMWENNKKRSQIESY